VKRPYQKRKLCANFIIDHIIFSFKFHQNMLLFFAREAG
jgi:hypothetical protein